MKMIKGRGYEIHTAKESKKEQKDESKEDAAENTADEEIEEDPAFPLVTHVNNTICSIFSNVEVYINNQQNYNSNGLYAHKSYISNNFKGRISEYNTLRAVRLWEFSG